MLTNGFEPWLDAKNGIPLGSPFDSRIEDGIRGSDILVAVLSPWRVRSEGFCRSELLFADWLNIPIIPIRIADVIPPIQIINSNFIDAAADPNRAFEELPKALIEVANKGNYGLPERNGAKVGGPWWMSLP